MYIPRLYEAQIKTDLDKGKIVILFGPRHVGKTTLVKRFIDGGSVYYNCDDDATRDNFAKHNLEHLTTLIEKYQTIIIDEAQRVPDIGLSLKIMIDAFPKKRFLVTGSSAFDLANKVHEPLTGRFLSHALYPIAEYELAQNLDPVTQESGLDLRLRFGSYPEVLVATDLEDKERFIKGITKNYLFKDILALSDLRHPELLDKLVRALGFQLGSEVSLTELGTITDSDKNTIERYINLLEKTFVIFSLPPYRTNLRRSIGKHKKYYFYDLGIRNAMVSNMNPLHLRNDIGGLWENYCIVERMKRNLVSSPIPPTYYFWRSYEGQELDLIEERDGALTGFECKYGSEGVSRAVRTFFIDELGGKSLDIISRENYRKWLV